VSLPSAQGRTGGRKISGASVATALSSLFTLNIAPLFPLDVTYVCRLLNIFIYTVQNFKESHRKSLKFLDLRLIVLHEQNAVKFCEFTHLQSHLLTCAEDVEGHDSPMQHSPSSEANTVVKKF
jgi:hypothetical protein